MKLKTVLFFSLSANFVSGAIVTFVPPQPLFMAESQSSTSFLLDIDNDGVDDVRFGGSIIQGSVFRTERANRTLTTLVNPPNATGSTASLLGGNVIGMAPPLGLSWLSTSRDGFTEPGEDTGGFDVLALCVSTGCLGEFFSLLGNRSFIGIEFEGSEGTHYGFFDVEFGGNAVVGQINGWAYESQPNTPITTFTIPEPSSILLVLLSGSMLLRRKR